MSNENIGNSRANVTTLEKQQDDLFSRGDHSYWKCEYEKAKEHFQTALTSPSISLLDRARCYSSLGAANTKLKNYDEALDNYRHQYDVLIQLKISNKTEGDIAKCLMSMSTILRLQQHYAKAIEYHKQALELLSTITPVHPLTSKVYKNIANLYTKIQDFDSALTYFEKTLETDRQYQKEDHLELGQTYADMATMFHCKQDYQQALDWFVKARETWLKCLKPNHSYIELLNKTICTIQSKLGMYM